MNKVRDIFYNINDVIIVLLIVAAAALLIYTRINAIVSYPEVLAMQAALDVQEQHAAGQGGENDGDGESGNEGGTDEDTAGSGSDLETDGSGDGDSEGLPPSGESMSVYINAGSSASQIADILANAGLVGSSQEFLDALEMVNGASRLKAGNFIVPIGSTTEEIVEIMTGYPQ